MKSEITVAVKNDKPENKPCLRCKKNSSGIPYIVYLFSTLDEALLRDTRRGTVIWQEDTTSELGKETAYSFDQTEPFYGSIKLTG